MSEGDTTKTARDMAFEAGQQAYLTEPADRKSIEANPFDPHQQPDERAAWFEGFEQALNSTPDDADLRRALKEARA